MNKKIFQDIVTIPVTDEEFAHIDYIFSKSSLTDVQFARLWVKMNYNRVYDYFVAQRVAEKISLWKKLGLIRAKLMSQPHKMYSASLYLTNEEENFIQSFICKENAESVLCKEIDVYVSTIKSVLDAMDSVVLSNYNISTWYDYVMYS